MLSNMRGAMLRNYPHWKYLPFQSSVTTDQPEITSHFGRKPQLMPSYDSSPVPPGEQDFSPTKWIKWDGAQSGLQARD